MRCAACRSDVPDSHRFCGHCGAPVLSASQRATEPAASFVPVPAGTPAARIVTDGTDAAGFTPGTVLAGRYRIVGLLGRGGMGEVYRADDLKLGQAVALKFLPRSVSHDPVRLERLFAEVRIARQVSHPNVCRVYDIVDSDGPPFLSMEYIDGEDLKSLLQRIGRLPADKALDVARQIVAGLAAAHDRGVLHRDLKPANVMLDGRGRVRITDFGLAAARDAPELEGDVSGTPAYMAPEQLAGKGASVRSDIYALGLVFYEIYTGRRAFGSATLDELIARKSAGTIVPPSVHIQGIDPAVEQLILRSVARDPGARPASAADVAAALPGGTPLEAVIRAGGTPSPEMVAAAGPSEGLRPSMAWALLALVTAGSVLAAVGASATHLWRGPALALAPEALADRARAIRMQLGYTDTPADRAFGYEADLDTLHDLRERTPWRPQWARAEPSFSRFWYRESPRPLESWRFAFQYGNLSRVGPADPPLQVAGMRLMRLDASGRLLQLVAVPAIDAIESETPARDIDWITVLTAAGFDPAAWPRVEPRWTPPVYADARAAWIGRWPANASVETRIEAAALRGRVVYFETVFPWSQPAQAAPAVLTPAQRGAVWLSLAGAAAVLVGAGVLASRNLRAGRGDRRGASRLAAFVFVTLLVAWFFGESHVATVGEAALIVMGLAWSLLVSAACWIAYVAAEPFIRRRWPDLLVSWSRLMAGKARDPLVGRDLLIGCAGGTLLAVTAFAGLWLPPYVGVQPPVVYIDGFGLAYDVRTIVPMLVWRLAQSVVVAMGSLVVLVVLRLALPSNAAAMSAFVALTALIASIPGESLWFGLMVTTLWNAIFALLLRVGLLAAVAGFYIYGLFLFFPVGIELQAWYAGAGVAAVLALAAIALFGFTTALAGRPALGRAAFDD